MKSKVNELRFLIIAAGCKKDKNNMKRTKRCKLSFKKLLINVTSNKQVQLLSFMVIKFGCLCFFLLVRWPELLTESEDSSHRTQFSPR